MEENLVGVRKGVWTKDEDILLENCIEKFGEGKWNKVPLKAGLNRCRKSCRMRWLNYLSPDIKRGYFAKDEVDLIQRLHKLLGNRWSLIAGRLPGRTAYNVKNFWNNHGLKKSSSPLAGESGKKKETKINSENGILFKPQPWRFSQSHLPIWSSEEEKKMKETNDENRPSSSALIPQDNVDFPSINNKVPFSLTEEEMDECLRWLGEADHEPTPASFSGMEDDDSASAFSQTQINQKISEFSSLFLDADFLDLTIFD